MKKIFIVGIMVLLSCVSIFAQNWTVDGSISFRKDVSDGSDTTTYSIGLTVGYYIMEDLNIGLYGYFSKPANGSNFEIGPRVKYDFLKFERIYFSMFGNFVYGRYFDQSAFGYNEPTYVLVALRPAVFFAISENIEAYWRFADLYYNYIWTDSHTRSIFALSGPFSNPTFGLMFRF